jgi:hypothetical protein
MLKIPTNMKEMLRTQNSLPFPARFFLLRYQVSLLVPAREIRWMNQND